MKITRHLCPLTAWTLYASVLLSLFVCGIHHGQMGALALSGLQGGYCAMDSEHGHGLDSSPAGPAQPAMVQFDCPLCSSGGIALAINSTGWSLEHSALQAPAPIVVPRHARPPPRERWPSLNPRASPAFLNPAA